MKVREDLSITVLNVKASRPVVDTFNQEKAKALVGAFFVITNLRMELFEALVGRALQADIAANIFHRGSAGTHTK